MTWRKLLWLLVLFVVCEPEDLPVLLGSYPTDETMEKLYGTPAPDENYAEWKKSRGAK